MFIPNEATITNRKTYLNFSTHLLIFLSNNSEIIPGFSDCKYSELLVAVIFVTLLRKLEFNDEYYLESRFDTEFYDYG